MTTMNSPSFILRRARLLSGLVVLRAAGCTTVGRFAVNKLGDALVQRADLGRDGPR